MCHTFNLGESMHYYLVFYLIGFAISYLIILSRIVRLKEDKALYSTMTALIFLAFIFGCKLVAPLEKLLFPDVTTPLKSTFPQMAFGKLETIDSIPI